MFDGKGSPRFPALKGSIKGSEPLKARATSPAVQSIRYSVHSHHPIPSLIIYARFKAALNVLLVVVHSELTIFYDGDRTSATRGSRLGSDDQSNEYYRLPPELVLNADDDASDGSKQPT